MLILGAVNLIRYLRENKNGKGGTPRLALSVLSLLVGIILTCFHKAVMNLFPAMAVIYGVLLVIEAVYKILGYISAKKEGFAPSYFTIISAVAALVFGIIIVLNPFGTVAVLWRFTGIVILVEAVIDILSACHLYKINE